MSETHSSSKVGVNAAFLMEIKDDHYQLKQMLVQLRRQVDNPIVLGHHFQNFVNDLYSLCDQLAFHFTLEEAFGYFDDALESTPHLHDQSSRLRDQHSQLFIAARDLADHAAEYGKPTAVELRQIIHEFRQFDVTLKVHESAEQGLIMAALTEDVGVGD
jgi:hypothetical protein